MTAGERVFVDFLPDGWTGPPPGLPQEVVRELSERARAAERALRLQRANAEAKKRPPVRVRASVQPTFVRFVFEMPDGVGVSSVLNDQKLTLLFNAPLTFDLADAKVAAPPNVASINQKIEGATSHGGSRTDRRCRRAFLPRGKELRRRCRASSNRRSRRPRTARAGRAAAPAQAAPVAAAPAAPAVHPERPAPEPQPAEVTPPTSETIAQQAKIEIKPETAAKIVAAATAARHPIAEGSARRDRRRCKAGAASHASAGNGSPEDEARREPHRRKSPAATNPQSWWRSATATACA